MDFNKILGFSLSDGMKQELLSEKAAKGEDETISELNRIAKRFGMSIQELLEEFDTLESEFEDE